MSYQDALNYIHSLSVFGSKPGLERVSRLVSLAGNPQNDLKFIHIAGTSGKGSTANFCASILKEAGLKVGLYTSPYIIDFRERFIIDGEPIPKDDFCRLCEKLIPIVKKLSDEGVIITEFEFNTTLGFLWFKEEKCDIVCLEVGMGGRFDATNVISAPLVSVIARIGLDHTQYLGNTIESVAFEKCGIIKKGSVSVSYPNQNPKATKVIEDICKARCVPLYCPSLSDLKITELNVDSSSFTFEGENYELGMAGEHQIHNALSAIYAVRSLKKYGIEISADKIKLGLKNVKCPARLEVISKEPLIIIDGAHNADKIDALYNYIKPFSKRIVSVCGMLSDKEHKEAVAKIAPLCKKIITVTPENSRALSAQDFEKECSLYCENCESANSIKEGAIKALKSLEKDDILLCWGSLYIAGEIREVILENIKN